MHGRVAAGGWILFQRINIKNFRTHTDTSIEPGAVTLVFGSNSAGKSNLLAGIRHFSTLAARGRPLRDSQDEEQEVENQGPDKSELQRIRQGHFFSHRHRLASDDLPMEFSCRWKHKFGEVAYEVQLYESQRLQQHVGCKEKISICVRGSQKAKEVTHGWDTQTDRLGLRTLLLSSGLLENEKLCADQFFRELASCFIYHFQPSFLKGKVQTDRPFVDSGDLRVPSQLGYEGGNLQRILRVVQQRDERTFNRFLASLQRFASDFRTIGYDQRRNETNWLFDLGRVPPRFDEFSPDLISDGIMRAAAIALLCSMRPAPALILIEEIENGISQRNIGSFLDWLHEAAGNETSTERGFATQFIVTSHSPSVLREYSDHLDDVFHVHLKRRGHQSVVRNLNTALLAFVDMGTVEAIEEIKRNDKRIIRIAPEKLSELWYTGVIGADPE
jgi:predicted ATPase